jgi:bacteriophage N4 adsorption protein B
LGVAETIICLAERATHELVLFAAIGLAIGGIDDLIVDLIWIVRSVWRRMAVYSRHPRADAASLTRHAQGRVAVFVPAWREAEVIGPMVRTALARWAGADVRIFLGCYANDPATWNEVQAIAAQAPQVRPVLNPREGPTTKADNLNVMWHAMVADEVQAGVRFKAVALHDAEDVVHPAEVGIYAALCGRFDLVQLPVLPLIEKDAGLWRRFVSATYADEFAEAYRSLSAVGAGGDLEDLVEVADDFDFAAAGGRWGRGADDDAGDQGAEPRDRLQLRFLMAA